LSDALTEWLKAHPKARLLAVDTLAADLTGADTHKQSEVRAVLGALSQMALMLVAGSSIHRRAARTGISERPPSILADSV